MTNRDNPALASLARRLVIAELKSRGARNPENVESMVAPRLRLDDSGDLVAVDHGGSVLPGKLLSDVLDEVQRAHPTLFRSTLPASKSQDKAQSNPFSPGPSHNVTSQMLLWRTDPERAEYLAAEAGVKITPIR